MTRGRRRALDRAFCPERKARVRVEIERIVRRPSRMRHIEAGWEWRG